MSPVAKASKPQGSNSAIACRVIQGLTASGNIYSNAQIRQHWLAERIYYSREAQAIMGSYYANEDGDTGSDSMTLWNRTLWQHHSPVRTKHFV